LRPELGTLKGGSAAIVGWAMEHPVARTLHLFERFGGLPEPKYRSLFFDIGLSRFWTFSVNVRFK
jgi:hypothetical protein